MIQLKNGKSYYGFRFRRNAEDNFILQNRGIETGIELDSVQMISVR